MSGEPELAFGTTVYDGAGNELGSIRGIDGEGFYVTLREGIEALSEEHVRSVQDVGEAELLWRCTECGEMGELEDELPVACPTCGTEREALYYYTED